MEVFAQYFGNEFLQTFSLLPVVFEDTGIVIFRKFEKNTADFKLLKELILMQSVLNKQAKLTLEGDHVFLARPFRRPHFHAIRFLHRLFRRLFGAL